MIDFTTQLKEELEAQLTNIEAQENDFIIKTQKSKECINQTLTQLKAFILQYQFESDDEEILFFKKIKPDIFSKRIYNKKVAEIESLRPIGSFEAQEKYLKEQLEELTRFFNEHKEFYQYYRLKSTRLDDEYFTRRKDKTKNPNIDEKFSTQYDYTVAKIIAYDQLEIYLKAEIEKIYFKMHNPHVDYLGILGKFRWTGNKIDLEELTYSLADSGIINNGKCKVNQLAEALGAFFDLEIKSTIYRDLQDIKTRDNPTQFLDHLKTAIFRRIGKRP